MSKILIIAGATASGKSELAVAAAKMLNGEVISADSMQIYKRMDIGTAKISCQDAQGVPHYLINIVEPTDSFSVAEFKMRAEDIINRIAEKGKVPIICGGTGLYIESLLYPLDFSQTTRDTQLRDSLIIQANTDGLDALYAHLCDLDFAAAQKISPNDKKRIIRALEINILSGNNKNQSQIERPAREHYMVIPDIARDELYRRIECRVDRMFAEGLEKEVRALLKDGVTFEHQSMQAIGYKEFNAFINGECTIYEIAELIKKHTRNYAKRQLTWFRRYENAYRSKDKVDTLNAIKQAFSEGL